MNLNYITHILKKKDTKKMLAITGEHLLSLYLISYFLSINNVVLLQF